MKLSILLFTALFPIVVGCDNDNIAPGNDKESILETRPEASPVVGASDAIRNVAIELLKPEIMTEADLKVLPPAQKCRVRMTERGFPVLTFEQGLSGMATIKLNGKLVNLPSVTPGKYEADRIQVEVGLLSTGIGDHVRDVRLVLRFRDVKHELGYSGFAVCR